jgi:hypothetical protein
LDNGKDGVTNVVVKAGFELFGKTTREKVVAVTIAGLRTKRALGR